MDLKWDNVMWDMIAQSVVVADFDLACFVRKDRFLPIHGTPGMCTKSDTCTIHTRSLAIAHTFTILMSCTTLASHLTTINLLTLMLPPGHVAPEVLAGVSLGTQGDLFSIGVMFALLLAAHDPYANAMCRPVEDGDDLDRSTAGLLWSDLRVSPRSPLLHAALELCAELLSPLPVHRPTAAQARQSAFIRMGLTSMQERDSLAVLNPATSATLSPPASTVPKTHAAVLAPINTSRKPRSHKSYTHTHTQTSTKARDISKPQLPLQPPGDAAQKKQLPVAASRCDPLKQIVLNRI